MIFEIWRDEHIWVDATGTCGCSEVGLQDLPTRYGENTKIFNGRMFGMSQGLFLGCKITIFVYFLAGGFIIVQT